MTREEAQRRRLAEVRAACELAGAQLAAWQSILDDALALERRLLAEEQPVPVHSGVRTAEQWREEFGHLREF